MKYSVALCSYNGEKYLAEQLESILNQTNAPSQIVICDDCSTDNTNIIVINFVEKYPAINWKHIINSENVGYVKNFEQAIKLCDEEIVFLSDQDDVWLNNKAEIILNYFTQTHYSIIFTDAQIVDDNLKDLGLTMFERIGFTKLKQKYFYHIKKGINLMLTKYIATGATMAFKTKEVLSFFPIPNNKYFIHDSWIITLGKCRNSVGFINQSLIKYRQHDNQSIGAFLAEKQWQVKPYSKIEFLLTELKNKIEREEPVLQFFQEHIDLISEKNYFILRYRNRKYKQLIDRPNSYWKRWKVLSFDMIKYRMYEFGTLRLFIGNSFCYIFGK